jgi:hypothetical protein
LPVRSHVRLKIEADISFMHLRWMNDMAWMARSQERPRAIVSTILTARMVATRRLWLLLVPAVYAVQGTEVELTGVAMVLMHKWRVWV